MTEPATLKTNFAARLLHLQQVHNISSVHLAQIAQIPSASSISQFTSGKSIPHVDALIRLSNLFAVSTDWLVGLTDSVYDENKITWLEHCFLFLSQNPENNDFYKHTWFLRDPISDKYKKTISIIEQADYSMNVRANIIYCFYILYQISNLTLEKNKKIISLQNQCIDILETYIVKQASVDLPVFDIKKDAPFSIWTGDEAEAEYWQAAVNFDQNTFIKRTINIL